MTKKEQRFHKDAKEDHRLAMDLIKFFHDELKEDVQAVGAKVSGH